MNNVLDKARQEPLWNTNKKILLLLGGLTIFLVGFPLFGPNAFYLHLMI
ncbi:MAG: branched-chain amino acid ABC transporter permease, partial [Gammaproteobacteria bacterium]|nr:branched-chain amino acid ABC transporter permease [Gammaproteobacteria bacterium]